MTLLKKRCVVYTRKSHEEGLEQEYNSLEAQRDAGQAYIASQRHEGWILLGERYDDGGYSGGNMERPALRRLLADIEARRIDVVVVYKIDRLSRALADFARMVDLFDTHGVTFVSVTQQFNTTTSMGRLTLNILLSFAQFEREVTGERIRDKIAASKAKGMWMGGIPPLGYDVRERKLVVNEDEAALVRQIFTRFAEHGSAVKLVRELQIEGRTTKSWVTQDGLVRTGRLIDKQAIYKLIRNRIYLGEIVHKGKAYPGQHEPIIEPPTWNRVQAILEGRKQGLRPPSETGKSPTLLAGLLYSAEGARMLPTFTRKPGGKLYRYYISYLDKRRGAGSSRTRALPAAEIEAVVLEQVKQALAAPEVAISVLKSARETPAAEPLDEAQVVVALRQLDVIWGELFPAEQHRILRLLIERVDLRDDGLDILWRDTGWLGVAREVAQHPFVREQHELEAMA